MFLKTSPAGTGEGLEASEATATPGVLAAQAGPATSSVANQEARYQGETQTRGGSAALAATEALGAPEAPAIRATSIGAAREARYREGMRTLGGSAALGARAVQANQAVLATPASGGDLED